MKCSRNCKLLSVLLVLALLFSCTACSGSGDTVLLTCNELSITESTFHMLMTEQAIALLDQEGITEENLVEKAKEAVLEYLPAYTYYVQGYQAAGYTLSEEDSAMLRANVLAGLLNEGFTYEADSRDEAFFNTFGATFEQYMDYQEQAYLISYFYQEELKKIEATEDLTKAYFAEHQAEYAICTVEVLRYPKSADGETQAAATLAETKFKEGGSLEDCKLYTGWDKAEKLTFDNSSNLDATFGEGFVAAMVSLQEGDVKLLQTDTFYTVAKVTTLAGYEENLETIKEMVQETEYAEQLAERLKDAAYIPKIQNQDAIDAITEIPGSNLT